MMRLGWIKIINVLETDKDKWFSRRDILRLSRISDAQLSRELRSMRYHRRLLYKDVASGSEVRYVYTYRDGCDDDKLCKANLAGY